MFLKIFLCKFPFFCCFVVIILSDKKQYCTTICTFFFFSKNKFVNLQTMSLYTVYLYGNFFRIFHPFFAKKADQISNASGSHVYFFHFKLLFPAKKE